jgi:hypothetical protein
MESVILGGRQGVVTQIVKKAAVTFWGYRYQLGPYRNRHGHNEKLAGAKWWAVVAVVVSIRRDEGSLFGLA